MRLRTKLVVTATAVTFAIVAVLSALFLGELLRQRIAQTAASDNVLAREVLLMARQAVVSGLSAHPPADASDEALKSAVADALRSSDSLKEVMGAVVRYSPTVQDVSVTDAAGWTLVSTDPAMWNQFAMSRTKFDKVLNGGVLEEAQEMFGPAHVLDVSLPLERNGKPFLVVHLGVRSSFLKNNYVPWLRAAAVFAMIAGLISMVVAGLLAGLALRPIEDISRQLERLTEEAAEPRLLPRGQSALGRALNSGRGDDAVLRVANTIDRLGRQIRTTEEGYTALQSNLSQMLDTLRDGVLLFTAERRAVMVSDAVANFLTDEAQPESSGSPLVGRSLGAIFPPETALGKALSAAFNAGREMYGETVVLERGRQVEISLSPIEDAKGVKGYMGMLVTLRDTQTARQIEQEMEISRRLAAIGRLTSGVGHEVKNPINAMVVHLELLKSKLEAGSDLAGAQRHADILSGEMQRLDRVVQTLADFSRPMELHLREWDARKLVSAAVELMSHELEQNGVRISVVQDRDQLCVRVDAELIRQALLNLMLNAMQAMPGGGDLRLRVQRDRQFALIEVQDEGEGIAPELMPRIFELYFTTKSSGSGIGLAMTYRILQMHGGALEVRSSVDGLPPERGTTFSLRLPLVQASLVQPIAAGERTDERSELAAWRKA